MAERKSKMFFGVPYKKFIIDEWTNSYKVVIHNVEDLHDGIYSTAHHMYKYGFEVCETSMAMDINPEDFGFTKYTTNMKGIHSVFITIEDIIRFIDPNAAYLFIRSMEERVTRLYQYIDNGPKSARNI